MKWRNRMKVKKLIEILNKTIAERRLDPDADVFTSGLNKDHNSRSLHLIGTVENLGNYIVIVGDK